MGSFHFFFVLFCSPIIFHFLQHQISKLPSSFYLPFIESMSPILSDDDENQQGNYIINNDDA